MDVSKTNLEFIVHPFSDRPDQDAAGKAKQEADPERLQDPHRGAGDVQGILISKELFNLTN